MITNLYLKNFRGFNELNASFMKTSQKPQDCVFIYGENGVGKTNLISAFDFLRSTQQTLMNDFVIAKNFSEMENEDDDFYEQLKKILYPSINFLLERNKRIGSVDEEMIFKIEFIHNKKHGSYEMIFNDTNIIKEELKYEKNKNLSSIFSLGQNDDNDYFDSKYMCENNKFFEDIKYQFDKYRGNHTLLSILNNMRNISNKEFVETSLTSAFKNVLDFFKKIIVISNNSRFSAVEQGTLVNGIIRDESKKKELEKKLEMLKYFYGSLYSNVVDAVYKYKNKKDGLIEYNLYLVEDNDGQLNDIPFEYTSNGTKKLLETFFLCQSLCNGNIVVVDELDAGVHDLLMKAVIEDILDVKKHHKSMGQLIVTTHDTLLMNFLKPHRTFILNTNSDGKKELYCLSDFGKQIQAHNNITKRYLEGLYSGIPYTNFSFDILMEMFLENEGCKEKD